MPTTDNYDQVNFRRVNLAAKIKETWGAEWSKPDIGYQFSNGRQFYNTDKRETGIYEKP